MASPVSTAAADGPHDQAVAEELLRLVGGLRRGLRRAVSEPWVGNALTGAQIELLRLLHREPRISVGRAAELLRLAPNTVSSLVGSLVDAGIVKRERDPQDRRVAQLLLTDEMERELGARRDARDAVLARALGQLEAGERAALADALAPLRTLVEALHAAPLDADDA